MCVHTAISVSSVLRMYPQRACSQHRTTHDNADASSPVTDGVGVLHCAQSVASGASGACKVLRVVLTVQKGGSDCPA